jgi:hypothetical protein
MAGLAILKHMHDRRTRRCASAGLRIRITGSSAAKSFSSTGWRLIGRR